MTITWIDGTTPLDAVNMNKLVQEDEVVPAATRIVASKLLVGDAQPAFRILGDGKHEWGPGGAGVTDVSIYRGAANTLRIAPNVRIDGYLDVAFSDSGQLRFGSALDTNLYRLAAGVLKTDGQFRTTNEILGPIGPSNESGLRLGGDANLYRSAAATLKTDGSLHAVANLAAQAGLAGQVLVGNFGLGAGIAFGSASDTNLYRAAAAQLATNGFFFAQASTGLAALGARRSGDSGWRFYIGSDGEMNWGLAAGSYDTAFRRSAAGTLRVNSVLDVETHIYAAGGTANQITLHSNGQIYLGNAFDTALFKKAGNKVGTIGSWTAEGAVTGWGFEAYGSGEAQPRAMLRNDATLLFGPGGSSAMDTSLYRSGAGFLRIDGTLQVGSVAGAGIHFLASSPGNTVVMTGKMIAGALGGLVTTLEVKVDGVSYRIPVYV